MARSSSRVAAQTKETNHQLLREILEQRPYAKCSPDEVSSAWGAVEMALYKKKCGCADARMRFERLKKMAKAGTTINEIDSTTRTLLDQIACDSGETGVASPTPVDATPHVVPPVAPVAPPPVEHVDSSPPPPSVASPLRTSTKRRQPRQPANAKTKRQQVSSQRDPSPPPMQSGGASELVNSNEGSVADDEDTGIRLVPKGSALNVSASSTAVWRHETCAVTTAPSSIADSVLQLTQESVQGSVQDARDLVKATRDLANFMLLAQRERDRAIEAAAHLAKRA